MLVYIKDSCILQILDDVTMDDVVGSELIEAKNVENAEMKKEISTEKNNVELIVLTPETLRLNDKLKHGEKLMDPRCGRKFFIGKEKKFQHLLKLLCDAFDVDDVQEEIALWSLNMNKNCIRWVDLQPLLKKKLSDFFKNDRYYIFVEIVPVESSSSSFKKLQQALIFIKQYDASTGSSIFFDHHYFKLDQTVQDMRRHIRKIMKYDGDDKNIAIILDHGNDDQHTHCLLDTNKEIGKIATKSYDTFSATVTFEVLDRHTKPKYLSAFVCDRPTLSKRRKLSKSKPIDQMAENPIRTHQKIASHSTVLKN